MKGRAALGRVAAFPASAMLVAAIDVALWPRLPADVRARLAGKRVELVVLDWHGRFAFTVRPWGFVPRPGLKPADLCIAATARDFGALACGEEDADTLYFARRLVVEGDTETALMVKNTLDALELGPSRKLLRRAHRAAMALRERRAAARGAQASAG